MSSGAVELYEANIGRLEAQLRGLREGRKKLFWILVASIVVAPFGLALGALWPFVVLIAGFSVFGVGHYIVAMHINEDSAAIMSARRRLDDARGLPG
jgi:hypothetical protein